MSHPAPGPSRLPRAIQQLRKHAPLLPFLLLWLFSLDCHASNFEQSTTPTYSSSAVGSSFLNDSPTFLPVEQAFRLQPSLERGQSEKFDSLTINWSIADGYYLYKDRFKVKAANPQTAEQLPNGQASVSFPLDGLLKYDDYFEKELEVFYRQASLQMPLPSNSGELVLAIESQGCADSGLCYPPQTHYIKVDDQGGSQQIDAGELQQTRLPTTSAEFSDAADANISLWLALSFALLGGIILNLMPCVFPVLSLKALSLATAHHSAHKQHLHGWAYTTGIVATFSAAALAILAARASGEAIGWGFQLQSPIFIALLAYLFCAMGFSLSGLSHFGSNWMGVGQSLTQQQGLRGSFFTGALAALVASPCTAPFMGAALGYALTQPTLIGLSVFISLGLGMALPFLILSHLPHLARYLPRPGAWMDNLKQLLAFPLYLTAIWLLWVLGRQINSDATALVACGIVAIAFAMWLQQNHPSRWTQLLSASALLLALLLPFKLTTGPEQQAQNSADSQWQDYSATRLSQLRNSGQAVFVNLTADWCITCLVNEKVALNTTAVSQAFKQHKIAILKGDWTNRAPEISRLLHSYQRSGVPLYLYYPADMPVGEDPSLGARVLPQLLSQQLLLELTSEKQQETAKIQPR